MPLGVVHEGLTPDQRPGPRGKEPGAFVAALSARSHFRWGTGRISPRAMTNRSDSPTTETAIIATLATATRACVAIVLALSAAHGAAELLSAL